MQAVIGEYSCAQGSNLFRKSAVSMQQFFTLELEETVER